MAESSASGSQSQSGPVSLQTPQSQWEQQLSQYLAGLGSNQYNWAMGQFNNASQVTDANINNYLNEASYGTNLASNELGRYENTFEPLENQYIQEAGSYASTPRINFNMGQAEAATGQAANQGRVNAEQTLQSYGINPSSGMYQELENAQRAGAAASEAGAGQQSELATEQTGRSMLQNAIQFGQQLPGDTVNALNSAYQGLSGAENAELGLGNLGVALTDSASPYFQSAMSLKYPPTGQVSASQSGTATGPGGQSGAGGAGGARGAPGGGGGGSPASGGGSYNNGGFTPYSGPGNNGGTSFMSGAPGTAPSSDGGTSSLDPYFDPYSAGGGGSSTGQDPSSTFYDPYGAGAGASTPDMSSFGGAGGAGDYNPYAGATTQGFGSYSGGYARGGAVGAIPSAGAPRGNPTSAGFVHPGMSPSGGRQTDDIPARLNAREFVIPQDVADWKGQEFFQKLINESRRARTGAPAQPSKKPAIGGPPRFISRHVGPAMGAQQTGAQQMGGGRG
jgi:hypothetical protein